MCSERNIRFVGKRFGFPVVIWSYFIPPDLTVCQYEGLHVYAATIIPYSKHTARVVIYSG